MHLQCSVENSDEKGGIPLEEVWEAGLWLAKRTIPGKHPWGAMLSYGMVICVTGMETKTCRSGG